MKNLEELLIAVSLMGVLGERKSKFNIGQRVKVRENSRCISAGILNNNAVGTVMQVALGMTVVMWDSKDMLGEASSEISVDDMEDLIIPVPNSEIEPSGKPIPYGSRVKMVFREDGDKIGLVKDGSTGIVIINNDNDNIPTILWDSIDMILPSRIEYIIENVPDATMGMKRTTAMSERYLEVLPE